MSVEKLIIANRWIQQTFETSDFIMEIDDTTEKGQGYMADFLFVKITFTEKKPLSLAIKYLKQTQLTFKDDIFVREICFYDKVVPAFEWFQNELNIPEPFQLFPKCYKTIVEKDAKIIIMENMNSKNYRLHPKEVTMKLSHIHLVLTHYAKFHALSFALQDQRNDVFQNCTKDYYPHLKQLNEMLKPNYDERGLKVIQELKEIGRDDLARKFEKSIGKGIFYGIGNIIDDVPKEKVITHGDCHNSNFLFHYYNLNYREMPSNMVFIDFQTSSLHSPMLDISTFLYLCVSDVDGFGQLVELYYTMLSSFLSKLGSDAKKLFSYSTMQQHWKRYSSYGFFIVSAWLHVLFTSEEGAAGTEDETHSSEDYRNVHLSSKAKTKYLERLVSILKQHFRSNRIF